MNWETKRKLVYALGTITTLLTISVFLLRDVIFPAPTCFDKSQNGYELDIDCGGVCSLKCSSELNPMTVEWSKAVPVSRNSYDLVGMIRNTNIDNASKELGYRFTAYDQEGVVMSVFNGSTTAPLDGMFPIIIQNIPFEKAPSRVALTLVDGSHYKVIESPTSPTIRILERRYEGGQIPRVYATLRNTKRLEITNLPVRIVLFDQDDNAYAVGQTIIPTLGKEGVREIIFTWNEPLPIAPTRIGVYPIFNPFDAVSF